MLESRAGAVPPICSNHPRCGLWPRLPLLVQGGELQGRVSRQKLTNRERGIKPISQQEKELTEALEFLVENLKMHSEKRLKRAESSPCRNGWRLNRD